MQPFVRGRLLAGALFFLLLTACAITLPQSAETPRAAVEIDEVPFFPQSEYQCGPAALATVLTYRGLDIVPDDLVSEIYVPERKGSLQIEMIAAVRARGYVAYPLEPSLDALLHEIEDGNPVLVMQNLAFSFMPQWHYAVVVGYDPASETFILRSGTVHRLATPKHTFNLTWERARRWAIVIVPPDTPPRTAEPLTWLAASADLERTGRHEAALAAYHAATRRWPDEPIGWLGLGNTAYALGRHHLAETGLREAVRRRPDAIAAWNNLAHILAEQGCGRTARAAISCGVRLNPEDRQLREAAAWIFQSPDVDEARCRRLACPIE